MPIVLSRSGIVKCQSGDCRNDNTPHEPSMAGKQLRRGALIPPEMEEEIKFMAEYGLDLKEIRPVKLQMPD